MTYRLLADLLVVIHFAWIVFMLWGVVLTIRGFFRPAFFERWLFRTVHLLGIAFVAALALLDRYCPLTVWEYRLRHRGEARGSDYPGAFIVDNIERLIYIRVDPDIITAVTALLAVFIVVVYLWRPPTRVARLFRKQ